MRNVGVYMVTNPLNEVYIGASRSLDARKKSYRYRPRSFRPIDNSLRRYGNDAHTFDVLEYCDEGALSITENFYIQYMKFIGLKVLNVNNTDPNKPDIMLEDARYKHHTARKIGRILYKHRKELGFSKNYTCVKSGVSRHELNEIENGFGQYTFVSILSLCAVYGISVKMFYGLYEIESFENEESEEDEIIVI